MVSSRTNLLLWKISESMVLPQSESVLMSVASVATKGQKDVRGSGPQPVALLVSEGFAVVGALQTWVPALPPWASVSFKLSSS